MEKLERNSDHVMFLYVGERKQKPKSRVSILKKKFSSNILKTVDVLRLQVKRSQPSQLKGLNTQPADLLDKSAE